MPRVGITPHEAAEQLGVSLSTVYRIFHGRHVRGKQRAPHARIFISKTDLKRYQHQQRQLFRKNARTLRVT